MQTWSQQTPLPRRRVSVPIIRRGPDISSPNNSQGSTSSEQNIDLLFAHSSARIVTFDAAACQSLLPWKSSSERTIASGPIRIYKTIPHNIAFLQSGSVLRPVLSKSQCWNVDGCGIFCLQIRPGNFWRLEILESPSAQGIKAIEFKELLTKILAYEVTKCPFMRTGGCVTEQDPVETLQPSRVWRRPSRGLINAGVSNGTAAAEAGARAQDEGLNPSVNNSDTTVPIQDNLDKRAPPIGMTLLEGVLPKDIAPEHDFPLPLRSPRRSLSLSRPCTAPPQLTDTNAVPTISVPSCDPSTPSHSGCSSPIEWHPAPQQPRETHFMKPCNRKLSSIGAEIGSSLLSGPAQIPSALSTPTLWSGSESGDSWSEIATPALSSTTASAAATATTVTTAPRPRLTRSASSLVLSKTAGLVGATANFMVLKPSSYIANMMFSIAARVAARAVTGAAYSLAEKYSPADFIDSDDEYDYEDDYGICLRPGRRNSWDKDLWGPKSL